MHVEKNIWKGFELKINIMYPLIIFKTDFRNILNIGTHVLYY